VAVCVSPDYARAHFNLGNALALDGDCAGTLYELGEELCLSPNLVDARQNVAAWREAR
jgi:hypothetical protein